MNFVGWITCILYNPSTEETRYFSRTRGIAHRARNIELERRQKHHGRIQYSATSRNSHFPLYVSLSLGVSSVPNTTSSTTATTAALSLALWRVSIGRDRRNLISMKRALGDFIRTTSYPARPPPRAKCSLDRLSRKHSSSLHRNSRIQKKNSLKYKI